VRTASKRAPHFTSEPETPAPALICPTCDTQLVYRQSVIGGVNPTERWDHFDCRTCGPFEYRHRTRQLRATGS
jgi:predicted RNA-binding Zn-ribbon protein involved in translation (DUF1610 family)